MAASVWKGRLAFGMVSIPVRLFKAALPGGESDSATVYRPAEMPKETEPPDDDVPEEKPAAPKRVLHEPPPPASGATRARPGGKNLVGPRPLTCRCANSRKFPSARPRS